MKIIVDSLGGDNAPSEILLGCVDALNQNKDLQLVIVGDNKVTEETLKKENADLSRVEMIAANGAVLNTDHPANFLREKPDCSLAICYREAKKREDIDGVITAGPTGAVLAGGIFGLGRLPGVKRPALMSTFPNENGGLIRLLDAGANMDCTSEYLLQFALMASNYLSSIGIENPRVGLLNVGSEEGKGNALAKETYSLLKESGLNFVGNIEADHVTRGECDVVVCDGFWGNIYVKAIEETALWISGMFKNVFYKNLFTKLGALPMKKHLNEIKSVIGNAHKASAPLLGVSKIVLKCHGRAKRDSVSMSIAEAIHLHENNMQQKIAEAVKIATKA
ncbi:MAG: phosphate acyltransferase PlsX [Bacilli bacterium]|nr:phosphate acyltransferase PlsX [Bacilli bacterium]